MSSERDPLDRYFTPDAWADAVVSRWAATIARLRCVVEPSVGQRSVWPRALRRAGYTGRIVGVDVDPEVTGAEYTTEILVDNLRFLDPASGSGGGRREESAGGGAREPEADTGSGWPSHSGNVGGDDDIPF